MSLLLSIVILRLSVVVPSPGAGIFFGLLAPAVIEEPVAFDPVRRAPVLASIATVHVIALHGLSVRLLVLRDLLRVTAVS